MSSEKDLPEDILVTLARAAKPVLVEPEDTKKGFKKNYTSIADFMEATGLKPGRNRVMKTHIYDAYVLWAKKPANRQKFNVDMDKILKKEDAHYKVNMMPITLTEKIKELNKNEEVEEKQN